MRQYEPLNETIVAQTYLEESWMGRAVRVRGAWVERSEFSRGLLVGCRHCKRRNLGRGRYYVTHKAKSAAAAGECGRCGRPTGEWDRGGRRAKEEGRKVRSAQQERRGGSADRVKGRRPGEVELRSAEDSRQTKAEYLARR
jgi:hypothetical protein